MSNGFIIDPSSVSQSQILGDLRTFLNSAPDQQKWKTFFATGTGQIVTELIAALGAYLKYDNIVARRETFLRYAQNRSSVVAGASNLGYSSFRGSNQQLTLNVIPNFTGTLSAWEVIGSIKDQTLVLAADAVFNSGVQADISVIIGNVLEEDLSIPNNAPNLFRFTNNLVSQNIRLLLNFTVVPFSERILDLINEKFVVQTNVLGSVDVSYLNLDSFPIQYNTGDQLKLQWIQLHNFSTPFAGSDVNFDYGTLVATSTLQAYQAPEDVNSIRVNAPLFNETQFVIRGREDYLKIFKVIDTNLLDSSGKDISPAVIALYGIRTHLSLYSPTEKQNLVNQLSAYRPFGVMPPLIQDPEIKWLDLAVTAILSDATGNPVADITAILGQFEKKLGTALSFSTIENLVEKLFYIKIARVAFLTTPRAPNTFYRLGKRVTPSAPNGLIYEASRIIYRSGTTEPNWPIGIGDSITDGKLVWNCQEKIISQPAWQPQKDYQNGSIVQPTSLIGTPALKAATQYQGVTFTAATAGAQGNSIGLQFDNSSSIADVVIDWNTSHPSNQVEFSGAPGNTILPAGTAVLVGGEDFTPLNRQFVVSGYINQSNTDTPAVSATGQYVGQLYAYDNAGSVFFRATNNGPTGEQITLVFNGSLDVQTVVNAWNNANPTNTATFLPPEAATEVLPSQVVILGNARIHARRTYRGILFLAVVGGPNGNTICLPFDGIQTVVEIVNAWNSANPTNQVSYGPLSLGDSIFASDLVCLSGGADTANLVITANSPGTGGNTISLNLGGTKTVQQAISDWNTANSGNTLSFSPAELADTIPATNSISLSGGTNFFSGEPQWPAVLTC